MLVAAGLSCYIEVGRGGSTFYDINFKEDDGYELKFGYKTRHSAF